MDYQEFFIETGRLFYAIAMADGQIQPGEQSRMLGIIRQNLREIETSSDAFGTANAFYSEFELERLIDFKVGPREAFDSFLDFAGENEADISTDLRKLIIQMAENVAGACNGIDRNEALLISELHKRLNVE